MAMVTGNQLRAARALAGLNQEQLATKAGVNINTVRNMEGRASEVLVSGLDTVMKVQAALETEGIEFLNHGQPGVRLAKK